MQPLSRIFRRHLFLAMVVMFLVGAPLLIGYSKGYRLNDAFSLMETGGIYIHSDIANSEVYLEGEFVESTGSFLRNTFIQDLSPDRSYTLWVVKEGYQSWTKRLPIVANLVTEARVLMLPKKLTWNEISATTTITAPHGVLEENGDIPNPAYQTLVEEFKDYKEQFAVEVPTTTTLIVRGKRVATTTTKMEYRFPAWLADYASSSALALQKNVKEREGIVVWIADGNLIAAWVRTGEVPPYFFCTTSCKERLLIDWKEPILRYDFYPNRNDVVIILTSEGLFAVELDDRSDRNIQPIRKGAVLDFRVESDGSIILFNGNTFEETTLP